MKVTVASKICQEALERTRRQPVKKSEAASFTQKFPKHHLQRTECRVWTDKTDSKRQAAT